ncbi:insulinase family protein [candidate division KSB1 bacterium]|nr:insulinase family protein [candidate division KSB1 bacterium]
MKRWHIGLAAIMIFQSVWSAESVIIETLPSDPQVISGRLENGITYYIRQNKKPEKRAEFRLVVNAGSVLEEADQQGLAHFTEHMAFNGTRDFEKQELVDYLQSIGMAFGPEINALTGFDETIYKLHLPTDDSTVIRKGVRILQNWAFWMTFDPQEIDKERGVIVEEWRQGRGAQARMWDTHYPVLFWNSRYAERLPIGKREIIENFTPDVLVRYYRQWYRPDLMAVVAVGDFDPLWMQSLVQEFFSSAPVAPSAQHRPHHALPTHDSTLVSIATDPEATRTALYLAFKLPVESQGTDEDYRRDLVEKLFVALFNARLDELLQSGDPPFLNVATGISRLVRSNRFYLMYAGVSESGVREGVQALWNEALRIKQFGFTAGELDRQKKVYTSRMERAFRERDKTESAAFAEEYVRNYLFQEPVPGIDREYRLSQQLLPGISIDDVDVIAHQWLTGKNRVVLVLAPEKASLKLPGSDELLQLFQVEAAGLSPYVDALSDAPLIRHLPPSGAITTEIALDAVDAIEWRLANGIRVVLKPTDFKNDQILFSAFSPGGHSLIDDSDYMAALTAATLVEESGVGVFSYTELQKKLAGKEVSVSPHISELTEGFSGNVSPRDLETLFQLTHLYFTEPRRDSIAYESVRKRLIGLIQNRRASPTTAYSDTIQLTMDGYHWRSRPLSLEQLEQMDLDRSLAIYRDRFADAGDFTFFLVGNFSPDSIRQWVAAYWGSLPRLDRAEKWRDVGVHWPDSALVKIVRHGIEPKSMVTLIFFGDFTWNRANRHALQSLAELLEIRLREVVREDLGGTYGVRVRQTAFHYPEQRYQLTIRFSCNPERLDELVKTVYQEIESFKSAPPSLELLIKVQEGQKRQWQLNLERNQFWLSALRSTIYHQQDPYELMDFPNLVDSLTPTYLQRVAETYLDFNRLAKFYLLPEERSDAENSNRAAEELE